MTEYAQAKRTILDMNTSYPPGSLVTSHMSQGEPLVVVAHALDSEDLSAHAVVMHPDERELFIVPKDRMNAYQDKARQALAVKSVKSAFALTRFADAQKASVQFDRDREPSNIAHAGAVVRHYKGGVYSILAVLGIMSPDPKVLYVSHADGMAWLRPWSEFGDGRFDPSEETVLTLDEAGLVPFANGLTDADCCIK